MFSHKKVLFAVVALLLMSLALSACGAVSASRVVEEAQIPQVTIKTTDFAFDAPAQIEAGLVSITIVNEGEEPHHVQLARLNDGVTLEQFQAALQQGPDAAAPLLTWAGGPGIVDSGSEQMVTVQLDTGQYVLLCFVPDHNGAPHIALGMVAGMEVVASANPASQPEPQADGVVRMLDFSFVLPAEIKAGPQLWKVVNEGVQPHEIHLIRLAEGKTPADLVAFMQHPDGPPPFHNVGGLQGIDGGEAGWVHLDLQPGTYLALCHIPDPVSGKPHDELGMVISFTVD